MNSSLQATATPELTRNKPLFRNFEVLGWALFILIAVFPVFWQLTALPIRQWDEARLAVNAAEMLENRNLIVTYFQGNPDMWNTKPPLQIWLLALSIKAFGYNEFAVRFPTALAVLATMGLLFIFSWKKLRNKWVAILSVLVLVSSRGYMGYHVARNGDYDALLVFFITGYTFAFFTFLEEFKVKYLWLCFAALTLAVLTKGVAGLMCVPALLAYLIYRRKLLYLLKQKTFYLGSLLFLFSSLGYYFLREQLNPGYLEAVHNNELGSRFLTTLESHLHPWNWYLELMQTEKFIFWFYLFPFIVWLLFWQPVAFIRRFTVLGVLFIGLYMLIISSAQTKLYWYDAPVYPIAAVLIALGLNFILQIAGKYLETKKTWLFYPVAVVLLCWLPYRQVLNQYLLEKVAAPNWHWETMFGPALKAMSQKFPEEKQMVFLQHAVQYNASAYFYRLGYTKQGYNFTDANEETVSGLKPGQIVLVCHTELREQLEQLYEVETLYSFHTSRAFRILNKK